MKTLLTTASVIALVAVPAIAQETSTMPKTTTVPAERQEIAPDKSAAFAGELSVGDLLNKTVKNASNEPVGDINDIIIDGNGKITGVVVGVGGFLGLGEKNVALPFEQLAFARDADGALLISAKVTKESLQSAPEWKKAEDHS